MESTPNSPATLNDNHKRHLLISYQYADGLLAEIESILFASSSKSPFPKYQGSLTPAQTKVVQDYIARIRAQMLQALKSQNLTPPPPRLDSVHSIRVTLEFADIAFDECRADHMRGYGEIPTSIIPELNGMADEMRGLVRKLSLYLKQGLGQDLQGRLERVEGTLDEINLLQKLDRIINGQGLVEFRPTLSVILDRLENKSFQIALFGRVSSGKSSLLNHILETNVLPVGVNPITAVPTRIMHGEAPGLIVTNVYHKKERLAIERLTEFASEQYNPGNSKNVARIVVEMPSPRPPRIHDVSKPPEVGRQGYYPNEFLAIAKHNHVFDSIIGTTDDPVLYQHGGGVDWLYGADVTDDTFKFYGMPALYGRVLYPSDYRPGAPPVFVMRYKTWKARFNGDLGVLGKAFVLNGTPRTLVGIMPPRFGWYDADLWIPTSPRPGAVGFTGRQTRWFLVGKLKPGASEAEASADLTTIAHRLAKVRPQDYPAHFKVQIRRIGSSVVGRFESTLYTVLAAVGLLLLIGCANVANLMLARATAREKEFALRAAFGAGRARLVRLLLAESLLLSIGGAALGVLIAWGGLKLIVATMPPDLIPSESVIGLNTVVLALALGLAVLTPLIFGLAPALQATRRDLNDPLRESARGVIGGLRAGRMRDAVVVMEVAVSLILLIGAGLLMRSFAALRGENLGLNADHVLAAALLPPPNRYQSAAEMTRLIQPLLARVKAFPGVVDAAESSTTPPYGGAESTLEVLGKAHVEKWRTLFQNVSEGYFRVLHIPFKMGRGFTETDMDDVRKVAVVNQTFVSTYLRGESPIGRRVKLDGLASLPNLAPDPWFEIIGVAADVANQGAPSYGGGGLQTPVEPEVWVPYTVASSGVQYLLLRSHQTPTALTDALRHAVWATDNSVALVNPTALEKQINEAFYAGPRFALLLMIIFGCVGLILVTVGVYSVLAYATARKTHEIGIRMALGAQRADVLRLVIATGLRLVAAGVAIGLIVTLMAGRLIEAELWRGVKSYDPATLAAMTLLLLGTGVLACWIPARRAARVDPMVALRYE